MNMEMKCGPVDITKSFAGNSLSTIGVSCLASGGYFGLLIQNHFFKGMTRYSMPSEGKAWKYIARSALAVLIAVPVLGLLLVSSINNLYWLMVVNSLLPMTVVTTLLLGVCDEAALMAKLFDERENDGVTSEEVELLYAYKANNLV